MGKKIIQLSESQFKNLTSLLINEAGTTPTAGTPVQVAVTYRFKAAYPVGSSDPSEFLATFTQGLIAKINATPEGAQMLKSGQMTLYGGSVTAGASNTWQNQVTPYDKENDYKTPGPKGQDLNNNLYKLNVQLSTKRAQDFRKYLFEDLKKNRISDNPQADVKFLTSVVNTGGKKDEGRDTTKYPNPGQYIQVYLIFRYMKDIKGSSDVPPTGSDSSSIKTYTEIKPNFVLTGAYFCNGKNSKGISSVADTFKTQCAQLPENLKDGNHTSAFEIKWNTNVLKDDYVKPIFRWTFTWSPQGKIQKIIRYTYNKQYFFTKDDAPSQVVASNDKEMMYFMGITENQPETGGTFYQKYIKPYL